MKINGVTKANSASPFKKSSKAFGYSLYVDRPSKRDLQSLIKYFEPLLTKPMRISHGEDSEATLC